MIRRRNCGNAWCAGVLLGGALLFLTVGAASGATLTSAQVATKVSAALSGPPSSLGSTILGIIDSVPADEAGQVAADILAAAKNATDAQKAAIGKALATQASALVNEGQLKAARAVVAAMESAAAQGDRAALSAYEKMASLNSFTVPSGPEGAGLTTQITSPE